MQRISMAGVWFNCRVRRPLRAGAAALALAQLAGCAVFQGDGADVVAVAPVAADEWAMRVGALEAEVAALKEEKAGLEKRLAISERDAKIDAVATLAQPEPPALKDAAASTTEPAMSVVPEIKPETVVAAADADRALADAPAKPVEPSPRLVQPSFASQEEAVFENEAAGAIELSSVLFGVHLASYRHAEEARTGWSKLQRDYPDELGLLEPRLERVTLEGRGDFLRLIGGGFSSQEKAQSLCATLSTKGVYCAITGFEGDKLSLADSSG